MVMLRGLLMVVKDVAAAGGNKFQFRLPLQTSH
jgi:hypothetical protein